MTGRGNPPTDWLSRYSSVLPVIDLLTMGILFSLIIGTALWLVVKESILPLEARQATDLERLRSAHLRLIALGKMVERQVPSLNLSDVGSNGDGNVLGRIRTIGLTAQAQSTNGEWVANLTDDITGQVLQTRLLDEQDFWIRRASELCKLDEPVPAAPQLDNKPSLVEHLSFAGKLATYRGRIWQLHDRCVESKKKILDENLLRFRYDKYDEFDMPPERVAAARQQIRDWVDQHRDFRHIHVEGHCDPLGSSDYNYRLSFMRAFHVAEIIRQYLDTKALVEGRDYFLHVSGYSWRRQLDRHRGESEAAWHSRLRRIEIGFQRASLH